MNLVAKKPPIAPEEYRMDIAIARRRTNQRDSAVWLAIAAPVHTPPPTTRPKPR